MATKKAVKKVAPQAEAKKITAEDIVAAVSAMSEEDKLVFASMLGAVPDKTGASTRRTVSEKVDISAPVKMEIAPPPPKPEPIKGVIFKSPHLGFWQLLKKSWKERLTDDDYEIHAPVFAEFTNGTWRGETDEEIAWMRAKIEKKRRRGGQIQVIEVLDERITDILDKGGEVVTVKNRSGITVDTPLAELVT